MSTIWGVVAYHFLYMHLCPVSLSAGIHYFDPFHSPKETYLVIDDFNDFHVCKPKQEEKDIHVMDISFLSTTQKIMLFSATLLWSTHKEKIRFNISTSLCLLNYLPKQHQGKWYWLIQCSSKRYLLYAVKFERGTLAFRQISTKLVDHEIK